MYTEDLTYRRLVKQPYNRLYSEYVIDGKTQLSERDKQRFTVM